jgi:protein SCO1/2
MRSMFSWPRGRARAADLEGTAFEDHGGNRVTFGEFFDGQPSIVAFFYTRCDNPLKCSLTVAKLGRVQAMLEERGLGSRIRTAAITYDPGFDSPARLRSFGERRGLRLGANHRMLRSLDGMDALRRRFRLGVNFVESLVNRHRIEAYVLDAHGRIAVSFERLRWSEHEVVESAIGLLNDTAAEIALSHERPEPDTASQRQGTLGVVPSLALAFLPKCPMCWATYLSAFGVAGLERVAALSWVQPLLVGAVLLNVAGAWLRSRATGRAAGAWLATLGALAIVGSRFGAPTATLGVLLALAGALVAAFDVRPRTTA